MTTDLSQTEIVTLAIYMLGGDHRAIDTEDAAIQAHKLAPGRFSWRKYPEQVNLELVRVYLSDAKKKTKGQLLQGSGRSGWRLTDAGLMWATEVAKRSDSLDLDRHRQQIHSGSVDEARWQRERNRIVASHAWRCWISDNESPTTTDAMEIFRLDSYAIGEIKETKITRLKALFIKDDEIRPFLDYLSDLVR